MDRREFFRTLVGGVSVSAAVRTWPFRVFSFPSKIVIPSHRFSFFEMFALNGPEMSEFLPVDFDMDLDTFMRSQRPWPEGAATLAETLKAVVAVQNLNLQFGLPATICH